jgi:PAS domain S-box-containing protein
MDEKFQIFEINAAMVSLFEYKELEFKGKLFTDLMVNNNQIDEFKQIFLSNKQQVKFKADFKKNKVVKTFLGEVSIVPIHKTGDGNYFQGIIDDITNVKKAERSLLMLEKMEAANRLARTLAHEIRNPLTNINLSLDHLRYQNVEQAQQHFLDIILRNSKRINDILSDLLASSTPSKLTLVPNNLQDIVDESLAIALDRIMLKKIKLQVQYSDSPIEVLSDFDQLKIAFLNIIINGIEAMEENIGKMIISIEENPNAWVVKISDNGSGISKENISRLFEPYFTAKRNGMGLGLTSSLNILKSHHAEVDVDSEIDKGTTFIVSFPKHHEIEN